MKTLLKIIFLLLVIIPFKILGFLLGCITGITSEEESSREFTYKPKGSNGDLIQVFETRDKDSIF